MPILSDNFEKFVKNIYCTQKQILHGDCGYSANKVHKKRNQTNKICSQHYSSFAIDVKKRFWWPRNNSFIIKNLQTLVK